jgi:hypothetical protein
MRYFLDCEYNGFGGALLSLALVPEDGGEEFYVVLPFAGEAHPWVARHVLPYLHQVPPALRFEADPVTAAFEVAAFLRHDPEAEVVADWPEDLALLCRLLMPRDGEVAEMPGLALRWVRTPGFSTAANSRVPHNALHDARALRDHLLAME